jgi:carbonic anhydrase/acetyltransferase-like protein (isoleucine patch superfamily)
MIIEHRSRTPQIDKLAYVAPNAVICGEVSVGRGSRIMFGACVIAEDSAISIGENCIVMENAVIRSTDIHATSVGSHCLVGPNSHVVGCTIEDCVFIATGASIFHGAMVGYGSEIRVNAVVHLKTRLPQFSVVPIGWVAVGDPAAILPPDQHDAIWAIQKPLNFPQYVYGVERPPQGQSNMVEITKRRSEVLAKHKKDHIVFP